jgi:hypothetical protein
VQRYRLLPGAAFRHCRRLIQNGVVEPGALILDESAPDDRVTLQTEVMNDEQFLYMRYTVEGQNMGMRQAYEIMKHARGAVAVAILKHYLDGASWDSLCEILAEYQDSVVELSAYSIPVGVLRRNAIIWETRNY